MPLDRDFVKQLVGQHIYAVKRDGTVVTGKLVRVKGDKLYLAEDSAGGVRTNAFTPLVLFDLLAIGLFSNPFFFGGFPFFGW